MRVDKLIEKLSEFPDYMDVQFQVFDMDSDVMYSRHTVDDVVRSQEGPEHFVLLEG